LGGIDGLLHLTVCPGETQIPRDVGMAQVKVKVIILIETNKISMGCKQLVQHPWEKHRYQVSGRNLVSRQRVSVKYFGAFVEIEPE
jgi:small subunit ribosomal protein S1